MKPISYSEHSCASSLPSTDVRPRDCALFPCGDADGRGEEDERRERGGRRGGGVSPSRLSEYTCASSSSALSRHRMKDPPFHGFPSPSLYQRDNGTSIHPLNLFTPHSCSPSGSSNASTASSFSGEERRHRESEWMIPSPGIRCYGWSLYDECLSLSMAEARMRQCIFSVGNGVVTVRGYLEESPAFHGSAESFAVASTAGITSNTPSPGVSHHLTPSTHTLHHHHHHTFARFAPPSTGLGSAAGGPLHFSSSSPSFVKSSTTIGAGETQTACTFSTFPPLDRAVQSSIPSGTPREPLRYPSGTMIHHGVSRHRSSGAHQNGAYRRRLPRGIFVAGFTEQWIHQDVEWLSCGISTKESLLVPTPDPFCIHIIIGGELVSTTTGRVRHHTRHLNLATGELFRLMEWESTHHQRRVRVETSRILSSTNKNIGVMNFAVYAQKTYNTDIQIVSYNTVFGDSTAPEVCSIENMAEYTDINGAGSVVVARTKNSCRRVAVATFEKCMWTTAGETLRAAAARATVTAPFSSSRGLTTSMVPQSSVPSKSYPSSTLFHPPPHHHHHHRQLHQDFYAASLYPRPSHFTKDVNSRTSVYSSTAANSAYPTNAAAAPLLPTFSTSSSTVTSSTPRLQPYLSPPNLHSHSHPPSSSSLKFHASSQSSPDNSLERNKRSEQRETLESGVVASLLHFSPEDPAPPTHPFRERGGETGEKSDEASCSSASNGLDDKDDENKGRVDGHVGSSNVDSSSGGRYVKDEKQRAPSHRSVLPLDHHGDTGHRSGSEQHPLLPSSLPLQSPCISPDDGDPSSLPSSRSSITREDSSNGEMRCALPSILLSCDSLSFNPMMPQTKETEAGVEVVYSCCDHDSVCINMVKFVGFVTEDDAPAEELAEAADGQVRAVASKGYTALRRSHEQMMKEIWKLADVKMSGVDPSISAAYRFNILQVLMNSTPSPLYGFPTQSRFSSTTAGTVVGSVPSSAAGGTHSWEVEVFIIPFLSHVCPERARNLLEFRCRHLHDARLNAQDMELQRGAWYPYRTITGSDSEVPYVAFIFVNAVIAYAMRTYIVITNDDSILLKDGGAEVIIASALVYLEWGTWDRGAFHLRAVSGPDTLTGTVNNNFFTNCMVREHLEWAVQIASVCREMDKEFWTELMARNKMTEEDVEAMENAAKHIVLTFDARHRVQVMDEHFMKRKRWNPNETELSPTSPLPNRSTSDFFTSSHNRHPTHLPTSHKHVKNPHRNATPSPFQESTITLDAVAMPSERHSSVQGKQQEPPLHPQGCDAEEGGQRRRRSPLRDSFSCPPSQRNIALDVNPFAASCSSFVQERRHTAAHPRMDSSSPSVHNSSITSETSQRHSHQSKWGGGGRDWCGLVPQFGYGHPQISRYQLCGLPDVVLACMLVPEKFTRDEVLANFTYYAPITVAWGSPLQLGIFSVIAGQLHLSEMATRYFRQTLWFNLSIPTPTPSTSQHSSGFNDGGIDGATAATAWWALVVGFGGMRVLQGVLHFSPILPCDCEGFQFTCRHNGFLLQVKVFAPGRVEYLLLQTLSMTVSSGSVTASRSTGSSTAAAGRGERGTATEQGKGGEREASEGGEKKSFPEGGADANLREMDKKNRVSPNSSTLPSTSTHLLDINPPMEEVLLIVHAGVHRIRLRRDVPETMILVP